MISKMENLGKCHITMEVDDQVSQSSANSDLRPCPGVSAPNKSLGFDEK